MDTILSKCALSALVAWFVLSPTGALAQDTGGNEVTTQTQVTSNDEASNAEELLGTEISYATRKEHWSVDNPTQPVEGQTNDDVMKRIFAFYNVKTKKFLSLGGWWGMRTVLSEVPYLFWLQRRNSEKVNTTNIVRYPENPGETTVVPSLLEHMFNTHYDKQRQVGIGSQQGDESFATYTKLQVVNNGSSTSTGTVAYTISTTKDASGHFGEYHDIDLTKQHVEAEIDLSTCKNNNENILSIGSDIDKWGWGDEEKHAVADNIHIYYNATDQPTKSLGAHELQVVYLGVRCNNANGLKQNFYNVSTSSPLKLSLTNKGLSVNVAATNTFFSDIVSNLTDGGKIQVGSLEGTNRSYATYRKLQIERGGGTTEKIVEDGYQAAGSAIGLAEGVKHEKETDCGTNHAFDISKDKVVAEIDLTTCKNSIENILSIGRAIGKWLGFNLHVYYTAGSGTLEMDYTGKDKFDGTNYRKTFTVKDKTAPLCITMSKDGVVVTNGGASTTTLFSELDIPFSEGEGNTIEVGSKEGKNRSNATYKKVTVGGDDLTDTFNSKKKAGFVESRVIDIHKDKVEATIDISTCTGTNENILSIGRQIDQWKVGTWDTDQQDSIGRVHIYYTAGTGQLLLYYIGRGQQLELQRTVDKSTSLHVVFSLADGLAINGRSCFKEISIPYREGYEGEIVRFKNVQKNVPDVDENNNYVIDDNGERIQRIYTNYIYADESRGEKRQTYFISSSFNKSDDAMAAEGNFMAYTNLQSQYGDYNCGVFGDRRINAPVGMNGPEVSQWSIDAVEDPTGRGQKVYTLSLTMTYNAESSTGAGLSKKKQFYLAPTQKYVYGPTGNKWYDSDTGETGSFSNVTEQQDVELTSKLSDSCYWKAISLYDYYQVMKRSDSELADQIDASFLIADPSFARENVALASWTSNIDKACLRIGYDGYYKTSTQDKNYINETDADNVEGRDKRYNHARYMAVNIYNGGRGRFYQKLKVFTTGWYVVHCKGMTNVGAKLFVEHGKSSNTKVLTQISADDLTKLRSSDVSVAKWPMDASMPIYNSSVWMNDPYRKNANPQQYDNQVLLYVDDVSYDNPGELTIGVELTDADVAAAATQVSTADEWTVFDDFRILFGGASDERSSFLILDEDKTSLDYIDAGLNKYAGKSLLLHRNFSLRKWNTFILPVNLTKAQFGGAFGEDSRLATLTGLTPTRVNFTSVDLRNAAASDVVLEAGKPYIIWPTKAAGTADATTATQKIYTWESNGTDYVEVTVGTPYYTILGVTLDGPMTKGSNGVEHYNFTTLTDQYTDNVYVKAAQAVDGDGRGTMAMKGTYCKNYEGTQIVDGHATLNLTGNAYAYVMKDNTMRSLPQGQPYGTKGMRCWFEYRLNGTQAQAAPKVFIDGVGDEVTSIGDVDIDNPLAGVTGRYAQGVFNLNGQMMRHDASTQGLPDGIYIVNGKKTVVRNNK